MVAQGTKVRYYGVWEVGQACGKAPSPPLITCRVMLTPLLFIPIYVILQKSTY